MRRAGALALLLAASAAQAEVVVVVGADNSSSGLNRRELLDLFMGRSSRLAGGAPAHAVDFAPGHPLRQRFYAALTGKTEAQIDAYWAQLVFAGRVMPPMRVDDVTELAAILQADAQAIGYLDRDQIGEGLKIVFVLEPPR